jgi:tetratricopeptide (TPR) repeat protein
MSAWTLRLLLLLAAAPASAQQARRGRPAPTGQAAAPAWVELAQLVRKSQYRQVVRRATALLEQDPDDVEVHAVLGVAWARAGYLADAVGAFALCGGSAYYEDQGLAAHADALAALGEPERAAALREQRLLDADLDEAREVRLLLNMADDHRLAGRPDRALDDAERALAVWPNAPATWAVMADAWLDLGQIAQAEEALWQSERMGATTRGALVAARLAVWQGDWKEALEQVDAAHDFRIGSVRPAALKAEVLRRMGDLDGALEVVERTNWRLTEDPEMLAARIRVRADRKEWAEADATAERAAALYPRHPEVQGALAHLRAAPR